MSQVREFRRKDKSSVQRANRRARRSVARLEALEGRQLLSAVVGTTGIADNTLHGLKVLGAAYDSNGVLYVSINDANAGNSQIDRVGAGNSLTVVASSDAETEFDGLVAGQSGKLYFIDRSANTIMKYDPAAVGSQVSPLFGLPVGVNEDIVGLTVSGADVWFFTSTNTDGTDFGQTNMFGRVDAAGTPTTMTLSGDAVLQFTQISSMSAVHLQTGPTTFADGVYIGFQALDVPAPTGPAHSAIGTAYFDGTSIVFHDASLPMDGGLLQFGKVSGIATDPGDSKSVWFAIGGGGATISNAIVHATLDASQTGFVAGSVTPFTVKGAVAGNDLRVQSLAFDTNGDLYFVEFAGAKVGMLDTNMLATDPADPADAFSDATFPALVTDNSVSPVQTEPTTQPLVVAVNPTLPPTTSDVAATVVAGTGFTWLSVQANVVVPPPEEVVFQGSAGVTDHLSEDHLYTSIPIAAFTAPTGDYVAIINWGDGTPPVTVTAQLADQNVPNVYVVYVNKSFAKQSGTTANPAAGFVGTVTIHETNGAQPDHVLNMTTFVDDTPLTITQFSVSSLLSRIATMTMTFTDDVDSRASEFSVKVNWGDGTSSQGLVIKDPFTPGQYFVLAIHVYKKRGTYLVNATVTGNEEGLLESATTATKTLVVT
jgi:hypothetical protein